MIKTRVIPCLDVKDGRVVKGVNFVSLRDAGDPVEQASAYDAAGADELMFLDITASSDNRAAILRRDHPHRGCVLHAAVGRRRRADGGGRPPAASRGCRQGVGEHRGGRGPGPGGAAWQTPSGLSASWPRST
jgi:hypothetical protein